MTTAALAFTLLLLGADPAPTTFKCQGEGPKDTETRDQRKAVEGGELFKLAVKLLGAPKSCAVTWTRTEDGNFSKLTYKLEKGTAEFETEPPESSITTLTAPDGFPDEAALKKAFKALDTVKQFKIDFRKPGVRTEKGEKVETYASPDDGDNAMVNFTTNKAGKLTQASFSFAL